MREAALRTKGSGGSSGVDTNGFKRILACKSFKRSSINICESIATLKKTVHRIFFFFYYFLFVFFYFLFYFIL